MTLNNWTEDKFETVLWFGREHCNYMVVGKEVGESGTPHLQGYFSLKRKLSILSLKDKLSDRAHFEMARGTT